MVGGDVALVDRSAQHRTPVDLAAQLVGHRHRVTHRHLHHRPTRHRRDRGLRELPHPLAAAIDTQPDRAGIRSQRVVDLPGQRPDRPRRVPRLHPLQPGRDRPLGHRRPRLVADLVATRDRCLATTRAGVWPPATDVWPLPAGVWPLATSGWPGGHLGPASGHRSGGQLRAGDQLTVHDIASGQRLRPATAAALPQRRPRPAPPPAAPGARLPARPTPGLPPDRPARSSGGGCP